MITAICVYIHSSITKRERYPKWIVLFLFSEISAYLIILLDIASKAVTK